MSDRFPRVRPGLGFVSRVIGGAATVVVKDPVRMQYFRFGEREAWLMQQMDGTRSLSELVEGLRQRFGVDAAVTALEPFVRRLKELRLVERTAEEQRVLLAESLHRERRLKLEGHGNTLFRMRFSFGDPDRLFDRLVGPLRFFWTPGFVLFSLAAFAVYVVVVAAHWPAVRAGIADMYTPGFYTLATVLMMYGAITVILCLHEVGHGLTCKRFGGEVHEIGAMLLYFMPAFFCNVNDAWTFEKRSHRLWVTFAGGWIQLLLASAAAVVWIMTEPGTFLHDLAFFSLLVGGGVSLLLNYNPLLPLDGYYALMDWLEIPNLRPRSSALLAATLRRGLLRDPAPLPPSTPRERRIFLIYGSLAWAYTTLVLALFGVLVTRFLVGWLGGWGWVAVAAIAWGLVGTSVRHGARAAFRDARALLERRGAARWVGGGAIGLALLVGLASVTPWTVHVRGSALIEPGDRVWLRSPEAGRVIGLGVVEGERLERGQALAIVIDPELELELAGARAESRALTQRASAWAAAGNRVEAAKAELAARASRERLDRLEARVHALTLTAPFAGRVVTPRVAELAGAVVAKGDSLLELWSDARPRLRVLLDERNAGDVSPGDRIAVRFPAEPGRTLSARVQRVSAASHDGFIEVQAPLPADAPPALRIGMSGRARIEVERTTLNRVVTRALRRLARADLLL